MYQDIGLSQSMLDEADHDASLEVSAKNPGRDSQPKRQGILNFEALKFQPLLVPEKYLHFLFRN